MRRTRYQYGSVYSESRKNGPAVWVYRFKDRVTGERRSIQVGNSVDLPKRADAERAAEQFRLAANPDNVRSVTFGALLDRYIKEEMSDRHSTSSADKSRIKIHIRPKWESYFIQDVKPFAVDVWLKALDLTAKSKNNIKWLMSSLFKYAQRLDLVDLGYNPMSVVKLRGVTKRKRKPVILSPEQFQALVAALPKEPVCTMVWLAGCLGLTASELSGLQWGDFDFEAGTVFIQRGVVQGRVGDAKNIYREAKLPLHPLLAEKLNAWRKATPWKAPTDWVFASAIRNGQKPLTLWNIQKLTLKPAGQNLGLGDIGWHSLRHTYRALLDATGAPMGVQQKLMRHASITTTMNVYGDAYMDDKRTVNAAVVGRMIQ